MRIWGSSCNRSSLRRGKRKTHKKLSRQQPTFSEQNCFSLYFSLFLSLPCKDSLQAPQSPSSTAMAPEQSSMKFRPTIKSARSSLHLLPQLSTTTDYKMTIKPLNLSVSHFHRLLLRGRRSLFMLSLSSPLSASSSFTSARTVPLSQVPAISSIEIDNRSLFRFNLILFHRLS